MTARCSLIGSEACKRGEIFYYNLLNFLINVNHHLQSQQEHHSSVDQEETEKGKIGRHQEELAQESALNCVLIGIILNFVSIFDWVKMENHKKYTLLNKQHLNKTIYRIELRKSSPMFLFNLLKSNSVSFPLLSNFSDFKTVSAVG